MHDTTELERMIRERLAAAEARRGEHQEALQRRMEQLQRNTVIWRWRQSLF